MESLVNLRSLVRRDVPFVAMTGTATQETRNVIIRDLSMTEPVLLLADVNRPNIKYSLVEINHKSLYANFKWIINELELKGCEAKKVFVLLSMKRACQRTL